VIDRPSKGNSSSPDTEALVDAYWQLDRMHPDHSYHSLPLESALPAELRAEKRDKYRTIMTMILSQGMTDMRLAKSLGRLFKIHPDFESLRNLEKHQVKPLLREVGIGLNDPDRWGNGGRLWSLLRCYFGPWKETMTPENTQALAKERGFDAKFIRLPEAYCWGNKDVFPLDRPAFRALLTAGLYGDGSDIDEVRSDVEAKLAGEESIALIDFHEMLRFIEQSSGKGKEGEKAIIIGWNAWRLLCSTERGRITEDWRWIYEHLVSDEDIAKELWHFYRGISDP